MKILLLLLLFSIPMRLQLASGVLMLGDDSIGYLAALDGVKALSFDGHEWRHAIGALFMWPFVAVWGEMDGSKVAAAVGSVMIGPPFYMLLRRIVHNELLAIGASIAFVWWHSFGFVLGYGFMTLLSMSMALWAFWLILKYIDSEQLTGRGFRYGIAALALIVALLGTNISALLPVVAIIGAFGIALFATEYVEAAGTVFLIALFAMFLVIGSWLVLGISFDSLHFRAWPVVLGLVVTTLPIAIYAYICLPETDSIFISSSLVVLTVLAVIGSDSSLEASTAFGRLWLWRWVFIFIAGAYFMQSALWWARQNIKIRLEPAIAILFFGFVYLSYAASLEVSIKEHSTLTPDRLAIIDNLNMVEQRNVTVAAKPESLGWHVNSITSLNTTTAIPPDCELNDVCIALINDQNMDVIYVE